MDEASKVEEGKIFTCPKTFSMCTGFGIPLHDDDKEEYEEEEDEEEEVEEDEDE